MKSSFTLVLLFCTYLTSLAQTTLDRNDAGLRGDAGATSGFFQAVSPVNFPAPAKRIIVLHRLGRGCFWKLMVR